MRNCSPRPPNCSPRSNATGRPPPTPSTRRSPPASPATTPPRNSSASSTSARRCRSSPSRCANTSAPQSVPTPTELPYIAELLDLQARPDPLAHSRSRRCCAGRACGCWCPTSTGQTVLRFVNETDMRGRLQLHHVRAKFLGAEPVDPEPNTLAGKLFVVDPEASVRRRGRRRHRRRRRPHLRRHPRRVRPLPPRGHRHRAVQGLRPAGHQGRPATGQAVRVPVPGRRRRQDQRADRRTRHRRGGLPEGPPRRRRHRRRSASSGATGPRRARRSASSTRSGARSTPRPPTGTPTGCASSTSCCWPTTPTSRRSTRAPTNAGRRSRNS